MATYVLKCSYLCIIYLASVITTAHSICLDLKTEIFVFYFHTHKMKVYFWKNDVFRKQCLAYSELSEDM